MVQQLASSLTKLWYLRRLFMFTKNHALTINNQAVQNQDVMLPLLLHLITIPTLSTAFVSPYNLQSYNTCCAMMGSLSWTSGTDILNLDPSTLSKEEKSNNRPQLAKDEEYASAILTAWKKEVANRDREDNERSVSSPITYQCNDGSSLYGHIYRRSSSTTTNYDTIEERSLPGIILFHTGAGPRE